MNVLVPFDPVDPKTRLSRLFDADERRELAHVMLADVLDAIRATDHEVVLLTTDRVDHPTVGTDGVDQRVDDRPLTAAVNAALDDMARPLAVVMADLALVTPEAVERLPGTDGAVVLVPGRGGGTNAMVVRDADFRTDFHGCSYRDHREAAADVDADVGTVDSFRLSTDVDEPADLVEVLLHAEGRTAAWLRERGVALSVTDGRVTVEREG